MRGKEVQSLRVGRPVSGVPGRRDDDGVIRTAVVTHLTEKNEPGGMSDATGEME